MNAFKKQKTPVAGINHVGVHNPGRRRRCQRQVNFSCVLSSIRFRVKTVNSNLTNQSKRDNFEIGSGSGEKGIALLFTLGILTVLLVLALGFATTSITQRRSAATNVQGTVARLLAESALERTIATLQKYDENIFACSHYDSSTHPGMPSKNYGTTDWLYRLGTADMGSLIFNWNSAYTDINWEYIRVPDGGVNKIIGRVAYVVAFVPVSGAGTGTTAGSGIDPGVLVRNGGKFGVYEDHNNEPRPGVEVDEMNLMSIDSCVTSTIANKMNATTVGSGLYNGNWIDFSTMFSALGITGPSYQTTRDNFQKWFVIDANEDVEAYWADDNHDNSIGTTEMYHRFNLARTDWDTLTVDNILAAPVAADRYNESDGAYNGGGLRWLANFGKNASGADDNTLRGTFSDIPGTPVVPGVVSRRNQIAANLIDYCDSDSTPTADGGDTTLSTFDPTYTGNDRTPYINEIGIKVQCTPTITKSGTRYRNDYAFLTAVYFEIANVYGAGVNLNSATTCEILEGTVFYTRQESDGTLINGSFSLAQGAKSITSVSTLGYRSTTIGAFGTSLTGTYYDKQNHDANVTNVYVQIKRVRLKYNGVFADFAKPDYEGGFSTVIPTLVTKTGGGSGGGVPRSVCFSYQANDPRQNLNDGDWPQATSSHPLPLVTPYTVTSTAVYGMNPNPATGNTVGTPAVVNDVVTFAAAGDMESTLTPTTLSTAYIRNGPMASPWEIGSIHRGTAWETINLKEYNVAAASNPATGGGLYTASPTASKNGGDANILDQIKMTNRVKGKQKVNLGLLSDDTGTCSGVLSALFKKIHVGSSYANSVRMFDTSDHAHDLPATGNFVGDRRIVDGSDLYTWNGSSWVSTTDSLGDSYYYNTSGAIKFWNGSGWTSGWTDTGTEISTGDVNAIVAEIKLNSSNFKTRANVANTTALKNRTGAVVQDNDRKKEEIIGKIVNLTAVAPTGYFTIIVIAQSIKDIGTPLTAPAGITISRDLNQDGDISLSSVTMKGNSIAESAVGFRDANDNVTVASIPDFYETIINCRLGQYDLGADEILAEQKIRADVYRDPVTKKCTVIKMQYVEE